MAYKGLANHLRRSFFTERVNFSLLTLFTKKIFDSPTMQTQGVYPSTFVEGKISMLAKRRGLALFEVLGGKSE